MQQLTIPSAERPSLSGYVSSEKSGKLLPWSWVDSRMKSARNYWIGTHTKGYPSSRPVWGIWRDTQLYFSSGSAIVRNIARDPRVQVNLESGDELVIIEGRGKPLDQSDLAFWLREFNEKYHWDMPKTVDGAFEVVPARVLAWLCDPTGLDGGALFANTATEWRFPN